MAFTTVTVTGTFLHADLTPAEGTVEFTLTADMENGTQIASATPVEVVLDATGHFSIGLVATDDTGTMPSQVTYKIELDIKGDRHGGTYYAPLTHTTSPVDITALITLALPSPPPPTNVFALDAQVVHNSGNETVAGVKTFTSSPVVPDPTTNFQIANKEYVDSHSGLITPASSVTGPDAFGATAAVGTSINYARQDHDHGLPSVPVSGSVVGPDGLGAVSSAGSSTSMSRGDHDHGLPTATTIAQAILLSGTHASRPAAAAGNKGFFYYETDTGLLFQNQTGSAWQQITLAGASTVTGPDAFGASAAVGTSTAYARQDHDHGLPSSPLGLPLGLTGATAATRYVGRFDGNHPTSGSFLAGDFSVDLTTPAIWLCTAPGSPGSWVASTSPAPSYGVASTLPSAGSLGDKGLYVVTDLGGLSQAQSGTIKTIAVPPTKWGREQIETVNNPALRQFRAALANRLYARCNIAVVDASVGEGQGSTTTAGRWVNRLAANLRNAFPVSGVTGGQGFIPPEFFSGTLPAPAALVGSPAFPTGFGPGNRGLLLSGTQTATWTVTGTSCDVIYPKGSAGGVLGISIDGGAVTNINENAGSTSDGFVQHFAFSGFGSHTVQASYVSGTSVSIDGIVVYNGDENAGITVHDCSHSGYHIYDVGNSPYTTGWLNALSPDLVIIGLGPNDYSAQRTLAQFASDLTNVINQAKACTKVPSILLHVYYDAFNLGGANIPWSSYVAQYYQAALGDPAVGIFDDSLRMPPTAAAATYGMYYVDNVHPSMLGHGVLADQLASFLSPR